MTHDTLKIQVATVHGEDGRLIGLTYDGDRYIDRASYLSWQEFIMDFALIVMTRITDDKESAHARRMIERDNRRIKKLKEPIQPARRR